MMSMQVEPTLLGLANTPAYERSRHRRKKVQMLFAHLLAHPPARTPSDAWTLRHPRRVPARCHRPEPQKARQAEVDDRSRIGQTGIRRRSLRSQQVNPARTGSRTQPNWRLNQRYRRQAVVAAESFPVPIAKGYARSASRM